MDKDVIFAIALKVTALIIGECETKEEETATLKIVRKILDLRAT